MVILELVCRHKKTGMEYRLELDFPRRAYFARTPVQGGTNIYQLLFERFVNQEKVTAYALGRQLGGAGFEIAGQSILNMMRRIEKAAHISRNPNISSLSFNRAGRGGASAVLRRASRHSRFTERQKEIILLTIARELRAAKAKKKVITKNELRKACLEELIAVNAAQKVAFQHSSLNAAINRLNARKHDYSSLLAWIKPSRRQRM